MKCNRINHYFGWLALSTLLLTTACAGIADLDVESRSDSGPNTVTFTIQSQAQTSGMRDAEATKHYTHISEGDSADVLIFAVYKKQANGSYIVDERFAKEDLTKTKTFTKDGKSLLGTGQTAIDATLADYPITLQFLIEDDGTYQVAFWAQNSETEAYDTKDLKKVEVKYSKTVDGKQVNFLNNTESRDAFCAVSGEISAATKTMQTVTLIRPLAQINVGTAGWDYEGAAVLRPGSVSFNQSKMTLKGVARYYDVLNGRTLKKSELKTEDGEATANVTFDYFRLPAFINVNEGEWSQPQIVPYYIKTSPEATDSTRIEELLIVNLDEKKDIEPYKGWDFYNNYRQTAPDFLKDGKLPDTEQFKYLSMCYVLVPGTETDVNPEAGTVQATDKDTEIASDANGNSTVNVEFTFKGVERTDGGFGGEYEFDQTFEVANVPVKKNWRTNLLSKNFFTYSTTFKIDVVPQYCGNYNDDGIIDGNLSATYEKTLEEKDPYNLTFGDKSVGTNTDNFFTVTGYENNTGNFGNNTKLSYDGVECTHYVKLGGSTSISFTTKTSLATVYIVQSASSSIAGNNNRCNAPVVFRDSDNEKDYTYGPDSENATTSGSGDLKIRVYTIDNVSAGNYVITQDKTWGETGNDRQACIWYVKVVPKEWVEHKIGEDRYDKEEDPKFEDNSEHYEDDPYEGE